MLPPVYRVHPASATAAASLFLFLALTPANAQRRQTPTQTTTQAQAQAMPQVFNGPPFSADIVTTDEGSQKPNVMKVHFGTNKMRWDAADNSTGKTSTFIVDMETQKAYVLDPVKKQALDLSAMGAAATAYMGTMVFFRPLDSNQPCIQYQVMAAQSSEHHQVSCSRQGSERVNGRSADKWEFTDNTTHESANVWIDPKLHFIVRMRDNGPQHKNGTFDVQNIQEGPQPASLFEVPAGYAIVDPMKIKIPGLSGRKGDSATVGQFLKGALDTAGQSVKDEAKQDAQDAAKKATVDKAKSKIRGLFGRP